MARPKFVNPCDLKFRRCRGIGAFAEQEIFLPSGGPYAGRQLDLNHQPWTRHWCNLMDDSSYNRFVLMHHGQCGGTLFGFTLPLMYHLFELKQNVAVAVPMIEMAWLILDEVVLPQINAGRYAAEPLSPFGHAADGRLSHCTVRFKNGAMLTFVSPVETPNARQIPIWQALFVTELNGFNDPRNGGRDEIADLEFLNRHKEPKKVRTYIEGQSCSESNRIWNEWQSGTASVLALHCPHCVRLSVIGSDHLQGWQSATSDLEAMRQSSFVCPDCSKSWTDEERYFANIESALVSRGQQIVRNRTIVGDSDESRTASLHVSIANNLLLSAETMGYHEWRRRTEAGAAVCR